MTRLRRTRIDISIVFRNQIDVVKNEALPGVSFHRLTKTDVEEKSSIERHVDVLGEGEVRLEETNRFLAYRFDEKDLIV